MDLGISGQEETQKGKSGNTSNCNDEDESTGICSLLTDVEKEHMFDKAVTPSDVGKLNRLVIPKQHAEKYFPLDGAGAGDKGLLLSFEDCNGKLWRFRYSYWNSSQSYVMTKGWSRFVKDKKLDAGDIVSFHRGLAEAARDRLFIDCRRRADVLPYNSDPSQRHYFPLHRSEAWNPMLMRPPPPPHLITGRNAAYYGRGSVVYLGSAAPAMGIGVLEWQHQPQEPVIVFDSIPVVQGKAAAKRLRLFGVNMDCPLSETAEQQVLASVAQFRSISQQHPNSSSNAGKGKSSMSLDLDI